MHHVTVRCLRAEFRLKPDEERSEAFGFQLGLMLERFPGVVLFGAIQMSNHLHLVLQDFDGVLDRFMCQFLGPLAKQLNALDHTNGPVFERRYHAIEIVDEEAAMDVLAYIALNAVSAGLVARPEHWQGVLLWSGGRERRTFRRFRKRAYQQALNKARGDRSQVDPEDYTDRVEVRVGELSGDGAEPIRSRVEQGIRECALARGSRPVLGMAAVRRQSPFDAPEAPKRSRQPLCHASTADAFQAFRRGWRAWVERYREASARFRAGALDALFPEHAFRPWVPILS